MSWVRLRLLSIPLLYSMVVPTIVEVPALYLIADPPTRKKDPENLYGHNVEQYIYIYILQESIPIFLYNTNVRNIKFDFY